MAKQKQHKRRSKKGKIFIAGKGNKKLKREKAFFPHSIKSELSSTSFNGDADTSFGTGEPQLNEMQKRMH